MSSNTTSMTQASKESLATVDQVTFIIRGFLDRLRYSEPVISQEDRQYLEKTIHGEFARYEQHHGANYPEWLNHTVTPSVAMAQASTQLCYGSHDIEVQLYMARLTVWAIYFDDVMSSSLASLQRDLIANNTDSDVIVDFRRFLLDAYRIWDPISANFMASSWMEFLNGCAIEASDELGSMEIQKTAIFWPDYLRSKTGLAPAYTYAIFSKELHPQLSAYIQIIGDANRFIELANDVLSFYKEELAGETNNYVHTRAFTRGTSAIQTHQEVAEELISIYERVCVTLEGLELDAWKTFVNGYLAFHVMQKRYRLGEILA
ncbi:hypothetical protein Moror_1925 [Moniliophthora roreri MCA 2997]|uniref:Terpenoid synthase n=2 Tax=Moniliophthora roreri TaxID=221103 RepID=V2X5D9_MONRO|nr:hypothetical protein Moror_1925 [Moniliophthora roreri MCA 2997]